MIERCAVRKLLLWINDIITPTIKKKLSANIGIFIKSISLQRKEVKIFLTEKRLADKIYLFIFEFLTKIHFNDLGKS